jgi:hypothetical protein
LEKIRACPFCGEDVKAIARLCRHCGSDLQAVTGDTDGTFVAVRLRVKGKTYAGSVFIPDCLSRVSDVLNDRRTFVILTHAVEETGIRDLPIGFLAINKAQVEWVEIKGGDDKVRSELTSRILEWK